MKDEIDVIGKIESIEETDEGKEVKILFVQEDKYKIENQLKEKGVYELKIKPYDPKKS